MAGGKPLVVVTGPRKRLRFGWWAARFQLWRAGLRAFYLYPGGSAAPEDFSGLIVGGGDDIDPKHYGRTGTAGANYDAARDQLELDMLEKVLGSDLPVLGICRGAQLLNVTLGGNLHQDIRPKRRLTPNRNSAFAIKSASIVADSHLYRIMGKDEIRINSLHSQAVDKTGSGLTAVAFDADGFIQATEDDQKLFRMGVQWHPEYLILKADQTRLFKAFAKAVHQFRDRNAS